MARDWLRQIDTELSRVKNERHPARIRTAARRIAGIALQHRSGSASDDLLRALQDAVNDAALPVIVRDAAARLAARIAADFSSPSVDPLGDAMIIVDHVRSLTAPERS